VACQGDGDCCAQAAEARADYCYLPMDTCQPRSGIGGVGEATLSLHPAVGWIYSCTAGCVFELWVRVAIVPRRVWDLVRNYRARRVM